LEEAIIATLQEFEREEEDATPTESSGLEEEI
jgi:hypothetical protein